MGAGVVVGFFGWEVWEVLRGFERGVGCFTERLAEKIPPLAQGSMQMRQP